MVEVPFELVERRQCIGSSVVVLERFLGLGNVGLVLYEVPKLLVDRREEVEANCLVRLDPTLVFRVCVRGLGDLAEDEPVGLVDLEETQEES